MGTFTGIMCVLYYQQAKNPHQDNFQWSFRVSVIKKKKKKKKEFSEVERTGAERNPEPIHHLRENTLTPCILFPSCVLFLAAHCVSVNSAAE